jgi:protoheme IX farnesyltransferase
MVRTQNRVLATNKISAQTAIIFATSLGLLGFLILVSRVNFLSLILSFVGFAIYVFVYSFSKYYSSYATLIGSIAGAIPPLVGYSSATGCLQAPAWLLFLVVVLWQMPHFYAISLYRMQDYMKAAIPVLPIKKGEMRTKIHMIIYVFFFVMATLALSFLGYTGFTYSAIMAALGGIWLGLGLKGLRKDQDVTAWARTMFFFSLIIIMAWCFLLGLDAR